jgi:hypothetical protein
LCDIIYSLGVLMVMGIARESSFFQSSSNHLHLHLPSRYDHDRLSAMNGPLGSVCLSRYWMGEFLAAGCWVIGVDRNWEYEGLS